MPEIAAQGDIAPRPIVSLQDFQAVDFQAAVAHVQHADCSILSQRFGELAMIARGGEDTSAVRGGEDASAVRVYELLESICGFHFRAEDRAGPYGPMWVMDGKRSLIPDDFRGEQTLVLLELVPKISHPGMRARIADVVWLNDRKVREAADAAIEAYCETVDALLVGTLKDQSDGAVTSSFEILRLVQRAIQIAAATRKRGAIPERVKQTAQRIYDRARSDGECVAFSRAAELLLQYEITDPAVVAKDAEVVAEIGATKPKPYPMAIKSAWNCAAYAYEQSGDTEGARRCRLQAVEQTISMRRDVSSAGAEAHWLRAAIAELRQISGTQERREALRIEMRQLQEKSLDELGSFEIPLDLNQLRSGTTETFEGLPLPTALLQFALLSRSAGIDELKRHAVEGFKDAPIAAMMSGVYQDSEGKIVAEAPGAPTSGEPSEDWYRKAIAQHLTMTRHIIVGGNIDPARVAIASNYSLSERHFLPVTTASPFVPPHHEHIFALGFARLMQGDFISAAHLLIPQLEHSVRYVLHSTNEDTSKIMPDLLQEDRSLSALVEQFRPQLDRVFTAPIVFEIDMLFTYRIGPMLRHEFAHGKIADGHCFTSDVIYACWFIYHLTCLPLLNVWGLQIAPMIEA